MTAQIFAEWLMRQGHHVVQTESAYWFNQGPRLYQAFPFDRLIQPSYEELRALLRKERMIGVRFWTPFDTQAGSASYHIVCSNKNYDLKSVRTSSRSAVRRGLEACRIAPVDLEQYAKEGWEIQRETEVRQGRGTSISKEQWIARSMAAKGLQGFEAWGAFVGDKLCAALFCARVDHTVEILSQQSLAEYLHMRVNNALTFEVTRKLMSEPDVEVINYGVHSLDAPSSIDEFKLSMGYVVRPVRQQIQFHPLIPHALIGIAGGVLRGGIMLAPRNNALRKADGIVKFYKNGRLPLSQQVLPDLLARALKDVPGTDGVVHSDEPHRRDAH
jgi:hypothetical protein